MQDEAAILKESLAAITQWYAASHRVLPWRQDPGPYQVWISEIMLQQTRIEAVIPYYERFMRELPGLPELAAVEEERLLKLWEGLGYYSRARNLKKAAQQVMEQYGGRLPRTAEELKKLPGIGEYTAGAIASIAFGQPEPAVDGNVLRVVMRLLGSGEDVMEQATRRRVAELLRAHYPVGEDAGALTEGLMELGEILCIPNGEARCSLCPARRFCRALAEDRVQELPARSAKKERRVEQRTVLLLRCGERWAIRKRAGKGLLAGLWELPNREGRLSERELRLWLTDQGLRVLDCRPCGEARHLFTHVEWQMNGFAVSCAETGGDYVWKTAEEIRQGYSIPAAFRSYLAQMSRKL